MQKIAELYHNQHFVNNGNGKSLADLITYLMAGDVVVKDKNSDNIVSKLTKIEEDIN